MDGYWMKALVFTVGALLPHVCVPSCWNKLLQKQLTSLFFVEFTLANLGLNLVSSAVVSLIFAVIYYELEVIQSMALLQPVVDQDDDEEGYLKWR